MNVRSSDRKEAVWRQLESLPGLIERFEVVSSPVLAPGAVELGRLTAFAGLHGAGKSYLLAAIGNGLPRWQTTEGTPMENDENDAHFSGSYRLLLHHADITQVDYSRPLDWRARRAEDARHSPLLVTRLTGYIAESDRAFAAQESLFLRGVQMSDRQELTRADLDRLELITGHEYQRVTYGMLRRDDIEFAFVEAMRNDRVVNSWTMSASEYWVHYVLHHLRGADENEVVIIDEPETFLAQPGHRPFINEIARLTLATRCQTLVATHSESMLDCIPAALVRHVAALQSQSVVTTVHSSAALLNALGRAPRPLDCLVFVEDDLAAEVVHEILRVFLADESDCFEVIGSGGKNEALRASAIVARSQRLHAVAVLDGDQRDHVGGPDALFLPGTKEPESMLITALRSEIEQASTLLRVHPSSLRVALDAARFSTHQGVFRAISQSLGGVHPGELRSLAIRLWLSDSPIHAQARALAESLLGRPKRLR